MGIMENGNYRDYRAVIWICRDYRVYLGVICLHDPIPGNYVQSSFLRSFS